MNQLHKINQASIVFDFTGVADAEAFESRAAQWVVQHFLPVIETVFDEVCPAHQTLVIDTLTLDLGTFNSQSLYRLAPEKLKLALQEQLRAQLHAATQANAGSRATETKPALRQAQDEPHNMVVLSSQQQRWNLLWKFLSTGILPWSVHGEQAPEALGLSDILTEHVAQLSDALTTTHQPGQLLRRVMEQFPVTCIAALFQSLTPALQWEMMTLLLAHPKSRQGELPNGLAQAWYARFTQLFAQHNVAPLRADWQKIIRQFAPQLVDALYQRHTDSQLPWTLVRDLTETERLLLLQVLTPQEYPFLAALLRAPELWQMRSRPDSQPPEPATAQAVNPGEPNATFPPSHLPRQLWLFTLHYLLVDRGSAFNRQSYMSGLVVHMANAQNQTAETLLASLIAAVNSTTIDSALHAQLLDLLHTLQPVIASPTFVKPVGADAFLPAVALGEQEQEETALPIGHAPLRQINELVIALCSGQEARLLQYWPDNAQAFAALLRWCGQLDDVRRHWSETYSDNTLLALVEILAPIAAPVIRILIVEKRLSALSASAITAGADLWKFTFAFLIAQRGEAFNQTRYLRYLLLQMAARRNVAYADLVQEMLNHIVNASDFSLPGITMRSLLEELVLASRPDTPDQHGAQSPARFMSAFSPAVLRSLSAAQLADIEAIIVTLQRADQARWASHIDQWQRNIGKYLPGIIREQGRAPAVLKRWATHFDDPALFTITAILNPHGEETVHALFHESQTIAAVVHHTASQPGTTNTRNALWELTLHYVISRRGSEFNQYQYLLSLTEQLSARYQVNAEVLIHEWLNLSGSGFLWRKQLIALVDHRKQPPVTAPHLLAEIQAAVHTPALSEQQRTLLHQYAAINAAALATQLQTANTARLARVVHIMQPQLSERIIALLPLFLSIVHDFKLASHWFYQLLLSPDCPATPEQWFQRLLRQISKHATSPGLALCGQLQQHVLSSNDIHQSLAERRRWLYSITPVESVLDELQQWLEGNASVPEQALLACFALPASSQDTLLQWLRRTLTNPRYLQRWLDDVSAQTHQALLLPTFTRSTLPLLALRHAFCQLFESPERGEHLFWQTLYRQRWLKGIAMSTSALMRDLLIELNQLWAAHTAQDKTPHDTAVADLVARLVPFISSSSLRMTLTQIANQSTPRPPATPSWSAHLDNQRPEIKQLIDAIEIPHKEVKKSPGILWKKPQDDTAASHEPVTVYNAGLVIASTYIPMLFQRLALTDGQKFVDIQAQYQGLFCLQWMTNHSDSAPEYQLLLNKVLCGIAPDWPVPQQAPLPDGAEAVIDGLLTAIIAHWKVLGNTSISGLQSTFIQREGLLTFTPKHWQLNIIPGTFDMLLDQLPWRFQTIKYPWMDKPLFVSWR